MVYLLDFFIGGNRAPQSWSSKFVNLSLSYLLCIVFYYVILLWWLFSYFGYFVVMIVEKEKKKKTYAWIVFIFARHLIFYGVVLDYNFVQDSNLFSKTNVLLKGTTTSTLRKFCRSKHNKKVFEKGKRMCILRMKIMKDFPEYQNGLRCFVWTW